jgi:ATP-dependent Clp protease ATP-binding subunit ClpA
VNVFDTYLHTILTQAANEAYHDGSATIEAQHVLLAVAAEPEPVSRQVLHEAGLGHQAIRDALEREYDHSLEAVGVSRTAFDLPPATYSPERPTRMGASTKLALDRGFGSVTRKRDLRPAHVLLGILKAEAGTVPRALALAGVDQAALAARLQEALAAR